MSAVIGVDEHVYEELKRDAGRYRWVRDNPTHESVPYFEGGQWRTPYLVSGSVGGGVGTRSFNTLDAAIDAAMAEGKE